MENEFNLDNIPAPLPFGVNTQKFIPDNKYNKDKVLIYFKIEISKNFIINALKYNKINYRLFSYKNIRK